MRNGETRQISRPGRCGPPNSQKYENNSIIDVMYIVVETFGVVTVATVCDRGGNGRHPR